MMAFKSASPTGEFSSQLNHFSRFDWLVYFAILSCGAPAIFRSAITPGDLAVLVLLPVLVFKSALDFRGAFFPIYGVLAFFVLLVSMIYTSLAGGEVLRFLFFLITSAAWLIFFIYHKNFSKLLIFAVFSLIVINFSYQILQVFEPDLFYFVEEDARSGVLGGTYFRTSGLMLNPNSLALFYVIALIVALRFDRNVLAVVCVIGSVLTMSKTAVGAVLVYVLLAFLKEWKKSLRITLLFVSVLLVMQLFYDWWEILRLIVEYRFTSADSFDSRYAGLELAIDAITSNVVGMAIGLGVGADYIGELKVHNRFVSIFLQFGTLGLLFYILPFLYGIYSALGKRNIYALAIFLSYFSLVNLHTLSYFSIDFLVFFTGFSILSSDLIDSNSGA